MNILVLGAHNCESRGPKCVSLLIDGVIALDAGSLTGSLPFPALKRLEALVVTHYHYDHVRDIPGLGMNLLLNRASIDLYSTAAVREALTTYLLNGDIYPKFFERPPENPTIKFMEVQPLQPFRVGEYSVLPVPLSHAVPDVGYQVTSSDGKVLFYTGDTGPGLAECWKQISPQLLIIEVTASDQWRDSMIKTGHLTPTLLKQELGSFRELKGYLPRVVAIHMNPYLEEDIKKELATVGEELKIKISLAREGRRLTL